MVQRCQVERLDLLFLLILRVISLLHFPLYVDQFEHEQLVQEQPPVLLNSTNLVTFFKKDR